MACGDPVSGLAEGTKHTATHTVASFNEGVPRRSVPLAPKLAFDDEETPFSYATRLAALHTDGRPRLFLLEHGVIPDALMRGRAEAVERLAALGDADPAALLRNALVPMAGAKWRLRGELFLRRLMARQMGFICPLCLLDNVGVGAPHPSLLRDRLVWRFNIVATCPRHEVEIVSLVPRGGQLTRFELATEAANAWPTVRRLAESARPRATTPLQRYFLARLDGASGPAWLDAQGLDHAVRSCEVLGAVIADGPNAPLKRYGPDDWDRARSVGFDVAAQGEAAIREALFDLQARPRSTGESGSPFAVFGRLAGWAEHNRASGAPLIAVLRDHILDTMPIAAGELLFGIPVTRRRLHDIGSLASQSGLSRTRLRHALRLSASASSNRAAAEHRPVVLDAEAAEAFAERVRQALPIGKIAALISAPVTQASSLMKAGLLGCGSTSPAAAIGDAVVTPGDVALFVGRVLDGAATVEAAPPDYVTLASAIKLTGTTMAEIVEAAVAGRIARKLRLDDAPGISGLRLHRDDVLAAFPRPEIRDHLFMTEAAILLCVKQKTMVALVADRPGGAVLPTTRVTVRGSRTLRAIAVAELAAFDRRFVTPCKLAHERGLPSRSLTQRVAALGLPHALDPEVFKARFHHRDELQAAVASFAIKHQPSAASRRPLRER
jgi:hypothetical protein